jgi:hypothetical protein
MPRKFWRFIGHILCCSDAFRHLHSVFGYADAQYCLQMQQPVRFPGPDGPDEIMELQRDNGPYVLCFVLNTEAEYRALYHTWHVNLNSHERRPRLPLDQHQAWIDLDHLLSRVRQIEGERSPQMIIRDLYAIDSEAAWRAFWYTVHYHPKQLEFMQTHVTRYLITIGGRDPGYHWLASRAMARETLRQEINPPGGGLPPEWLNQDAIRSLLRTYRCYVRHDTASGTYQVVCLQTHLPIPPLAIQ